MTATKMTKLTIQLDEAEVKQLQVLAAKANYENWRDYTTDEFTIKVLQQKVGVPMIGAHSAAAGGRITGASSGVSY